MIYEKAYPFFLFNDCSLGASFVEACYWIGHSVYSVSVVPWRLWRMLRSILSSLFFFFFFILLYEFIWYPSELAFVGVIGACSFKDGHFRWLVRICIMKLQIHSGFYWDIHWEVRPYHEDCQDVRERAILLKMRPGRYPKAETCQHSKQHLLYEPYTTHTTHTTTHSDQHLGKAILPQD